MTARRTIVLGGILIAAVAAGAWYWRTSVRDPGRNVLLITISGIRADHLASYGHDPAATPTLDALAERGVLFERAMSTAPVTLPAHASLLTGLHPLEHGLITRGKDPLPKDARTLAEILSERGYRSAAFTSAYALDSRYGLDQGFEVYDDDLSGTRRGPTNLYVERPADSMIDAATAWLELHPAESPFHCWIHLNDPAPPFESHEVDGEDPFSDSPYDGEIAFVDRQLARVIDLLEQRGLRQRTLIVVAGDHGTALGEHAEQGSGALLHATTLHVPLIIVPPETDGVAPARVAGPVSAVDVLPTILDLLGLPAPPTGSGVSLSAALREGSLLNRECLSMTAEPLFKNACAPLHSLTTTEWKYVDAPIPELYDLQADPGENTNLAAEQPDRTAELAARLEELKDALRQSSHAQQKLQDAIRRAVEWQSDGATSDVPVASDPQALPDVKDKLYLFDMQREALRLLEDEQPEAAERVVRDVVTVDPHFVQAWLVLGQCLVPLGQTEEAIDCFQRVLRFDPQNVDAMLRLASVQSRTLRIEDSIATYQAATAADPRSPVAPHFLGMLYLQNGDELNAELQFSEALRRDPTYDPAICSQGELAIRQGDGPRAFERFEAALAVNPRSASATLNLGVYAANAEEYDVAEDFFEQAIALDPGDPLARESLARIDLFRNQPEKAAQQFEAILADNPDHFSTIISLGWLRAAHPADDIRDAGRALELADRAIAVGGSESPDALDLLAGAQACDGRFQEALATVNKALELAADIPDYPVLQMEYRRQHYATGTPYRSTLTETMNAPVR